MTETAPLLSRPAVLAEVIQLIMAGCKERGWTIDASRPGTNNRDGQCVAHIRDQHGDTIGMGMSDGSNAVAICEAFRSAWASTYPQSLEDSPS